MLSGIPEAIRRLEGELQAFLSSPPASERFSDRNPRLRAYSPQLPRYVILRIWWYRYYCDLLQALTEDSEECPGDNSATV